MHISAVLSRRSKERNNIIYLITARINNKSIKGIKVDRGRFNSRTKGEINRHLILVFDSYGSC